MPIYTLRCKICNRVNDRLLSINERLPQCECGGDLVKTPALPNFYLNGADFTNIGMSGKKAWVDRTEVNKSVNKD